MLDVKENVQRNENIYNEFTCMWEQLQRDKHEVEHSQKKMLQEK